MSGGSLNYIYLKLEAEIHNIKDDNREVKAFKTHLLKVVKALHDIEWVQSGDCSEGGELEAIRDCISNVAILDNAIEEAERIVEELQNLIEFSRTAKNLEEPKVEIKENFITDLNDLQVGKVYEFLWGSNENSKEQLKQLLQYRGISYEVGRIPEHYNFHKADCVWTAPVNLMTDKLLNALEKKSVIIKEVK